MIKNTFQVVKKKFNSVADLCVSFSSTIIHVRLLDGFDLTNSDSFPNEILPPVEYRIFSQKSKL